MVVKDAVGREEDDTARGGTRRRRRRVSGWSTFEDAAAAVLYSEHSPEGGVIM